MNDDDVWEVKPPDPRLAQLSALLKQEDPPQGEMVELSEAAFLTLCEGMTRDEYSLIKEAFVLPAYFLPPWGVETKEAALGMHRLFKGQGHLRYLRAALHLLRQTSG